MHKGKRFLALLLGLAVLAPAPAVFAQVRVVPGESGLPVVPSAAGAVSAAPSALLLAPSLSAASVLAAPAPAPALALAPAPAASVPIAAAAAPAAAADAPAGPRALGGARAALAAPSDGPAAPRAGAGEAEAAAAAAEFDGEKTGRSLDAPAVAGRDSSSAPALRAASAAPAASIFDPGPRTASLHDRLRDRARYTRMLSRSFWWYMYTHIKDMWPSYRSRWSKASGEGGAAVSRPRAFFTAMRVTGMSGRFYALGGSALEDDLVIAEFRAAFVRYFDAPGVGAREREALEAFMARAKGFNAEKRAHPNMYKNIRDPLIKASTMRPDRLAPYFDSLIPPEKELTTKEYQQSGRMDRTREAFLAVLRETLDEENPRDPLRVRAAIVLGSFASGSAGPGSDFDVEALVDGASDARLPAFMKRLTDRWTAAGYHKTNPVTVHDHAAWPSWGVVNIVQTRHYIVVSPEPALAVRLSRQAFEDPAVHLERGYTVRGRVNRVFQRAVVAAATYVSDAKAALGVKPSSSGH
ncbi:MAG TPA: nucleotidyltransferase domain-containing protein [Elusimicrobiota bacterium]|jgi:hypothetical protein|nr:nucleotidyltransferase domain-containing protein [Elusimicrobiota bacterium]